MKITRKQLRSLLNEDIDAAYDVDLYLQGLKSLHAKLKGYHQELKAASFGDYTETIHREITDALSSLNLVIAALEETAVEYEKLGDMKIKPRSQRIDSATGEYLKKPSYAMGENMKITRGQLRGLINEQYAAMANGGFSPMKSRADPEFARLIKGVINETEHDELDRPPEGLGDTLLEPEDRPPEGLGHTLSGPDDTQDMIEDLGIELANLFNTTGFVDLSLDDIIDALIFSLTPPHMGMSEQEIAKSFGKAIYKIDYPQGR